jgi:hypothetical protein
MPQGIPSLFLLKPIQIIFDKNINYNQNKTFYSEIRKHLVS